MKMISYIKKMTLYYTILTSSFLNSILTYGSSNAGAANDAANELKKILTNDNGTGLMDIVQSAGFVIVAFGIGQMVIAFKDDNADQKAKGSMILLGGMFCIIIKVVLEKLGAL